MVPSRLKVEILVSWLWVKRGVFAGIKKLGWYSVGRVRVSLVLNTKVQRVSFEYFTRRGCSTSRDCSTSAKVHICPLYLMRHVRDGGQNYQTPVDVWVIHTLINLG